MSKRTRGPYTLDPATPPAIYEERSPTGHIICLFNAEWRSAEENLANAEFFHRAASAHDDLLRALKEVVALSDRKHDAWDRAHAAIAKAEGR